MRPLIACLVATLAMACSESGRGGSEADAGGADTGVGGDDAGAEVAGVGGL